MYTAGDIGTLINLSCEILERPITPKSDQKVRISFPRQIYREFITFERKGLFENV